MTSGFGTTDTRDHVEEAIERSRRAFDAADDELGIFVTPLHDQALQAHRGDPQDGPLAGVTLGVKDVIFESSAPTTAQSDVALADWPEDQPEAACSKPS